LPSQQSLPVNADQLKSLFHHYTRIQYFLDTIELLFMSDSTLLPNDESKGSSSRLETDNNPSTQTNSYWSWWEQAKEKAQIQAKELASKAQILAEQASKVAHEKASELANKAQEMRQNYDFETASQVLMNSLAAPPLDSMQQNKEHGKLRQVPRAPLDLIYLTENIVAMAFPVDFSNLKPGNQKTGNDIRAVSLFLKRRHAGHYMIWNISEEGYDYSLFNDQVLEYKFPGHPAPPLGLLFKICTSMESWLDADEKNIAVAHCLTGKGRTAALLACVMTWIGEFSSPVEALQYIADRRSISVDFLTIPSQRRYLQYFSNMLDGVKPRSEPLLLRRIIISGIPIFGDNGGGEENNGCCPYIQLFKSGKLIATAAPSLNDVYGAASGHPSPKLQLKWVQVSEGSVSFNMDCAVQGDILLRCRHADSSGARVSMFRAAFHTGYVPCGVLRLTKAQLDGASSDARFDEEFFIDLIFAPIEKATAVSSSSGSSGQVVGVPSDSGLIIDATSTDRYELSLHRDSKFWEAVSARKARSKKRRSRKFLSNTQEQFSIGDDLGNYEDEMNEIKFSTSPIKPPAYLIGIDGDVSLMSDEELIMQLAQAQDEPMLSSNLATSSTKSSTSSLPAATSSEGQAANMELQALEELERELGLDDLNLFKSPSAGTAAGVSGAASTISATTTSTVSNISQPISTMASATSATSDEDNLDELEKYLQSLNTI
jgi:hypothetical protein